MSWWAALIVAIAAGLTWSLALLGLAPADGPNGDVPPERAGVCIMAGIALAIGLCVYLVAT